MAYTIGEVAAKMNLTPYTLRYYDKEGLMPFVARTASGIRMFSDSDLDTLRIVECLKATGMSIRDIKTFIDWCAEGDASLEKRYRMFLERRAAVEAQMEELKKTMETIEYKCEYYRKAVEAGTEAVHGAKKQQCAVHQKAGGRIKKVTHSKI